MAQLDFQTPGMTFRELMEARLVMEPMMARLAAERRDPALVAELQEAVTTAGSVRLSDDVAYPSTSADFHAVVARMSGNRILDLVGGALLEIFYDRVSGMLFPVSRRGAVCDAHARIADATGGERRAGGDADASAHGGVRGVREAPPPGAARRGRRLALSAAPAPLRSVYFVPAALPTPASGHCTCLTWKNSANPASPRS